MHRHRHFHGGFGRRHRRFPNREEWLRRLEEYQRDLEQEIADVDDEGRAVDLKLCEQVTRVLSEYLRDYGVDVSSPGPERPLRKPEHFRRALGRRVKLKTEGRKLRGEVTRAGESSVTVAAKGGEIDIPYGEIVRGNLIEEKEGR